MAQRAAIASGNWSNPAIWNVGVLPEPGDLVASNGFTVTIDQNINVDTITNGATGVGTAVPIMTSNTAPSGIASHSGTGNFVYYTAFTSFNGDVSNNCYGGNTVIGEFIAYEFTSPKKIGQFGIRYNGGNSSINYSLDGWNGSTWVTIGTHNTSGGATSPMFSNPTAYIKYRIQFLTAGVYTQINEFFMYDALSVAATSGGTFILNSGVTVTCTNIGDGISSAVGACVTYSGVGTSTINANILGSTTGTPGCIGVRVTGTGILNINGNLVGYRTSSSNNTRALSIEANGTVNLTGNISVPNQFVVYISSQCTFNIVGNVYVGTYNTTTTVYCVGTNAVINLTGNVYGQGGVGGWGMTGIYLGAICTLNITGNLIGSNSDSRSHTLISVGANATVNITGTMQSGVNGSSDYGEVCFASVVSSYLNHIGSVIASLSGYALYSTGSGAINIMTGPFISSPTGMQPLYVSRMHYRRTMGSYYEFRNNSTNGALPPAASAPATRLVSPDTVVDAPIPANVRFGISYALGSQIGTMKVPVAGAVMFGVAVDNTVGTALLSAAQVWNYLRNDISVSGSIGDRLKNCATVESTGSQIASFKSS